MASGKFFLLRRMRRLEYQMVPTKLNRGLFSKKHHLTCIIPDRNSVKGVLYGAFPHLF